MSRFTIKDLRAVIEDANARLAGTGYTILEQGRNGYQAADLYKGGSCLRNVGCGTSREVAEYVRTEAANVLLACKVEARGYRCSCGAEKGQIHANGCPNEGPYTVTNGHAENGPACPVVYAERMQVVVYHWHGRDGAERCKVVAEALNKFEGGR